MKTPREILLEHHRKTEPKLEALRRKVVTALAAGEEVEHLEVDRGGKALRKLWLELIWPSRRAWGAMAILWLGLLAANLQLKSSSPARSVVRPAQSRDFEQALEEQRRVLAELLPPASPPPPVASLPKPAPPRPRSDAPMRFKVC